MTSTKAFLGKTDLTGPRLRHVVFRDPGGGCPVDLAPPIAPVPVVRAACSILTSDETSLVNWMFVRAGLDAAVYRDETLHRRLPACLRVLRTTDLRRARELMETDADLFRRAMGSLLIGVTSFFRDPAVFEHIRADVIPLLLRRSGHPRVWSAGCSDGQELYSVAMLLSESGRLTGATLLGTDCRTEAIARARDARYDTRAAADIPADLLERYVVGSGKTKQITAPLRQATQWRVADITRTHEPGEWDMILCRNSVMYLRPESAATVWKSCEASLRTGGMLVLGRAERPLGASRLVMQSPCIYRKE